MENLTRRNFLKGSGAAVALTAMNPALNAASFAGTKREKVLTASKFGIFDAEIVDGKLTRVHPIKRDKHPAPMVQGIPDLVYSNTRVNYPYVRESFLKYGHKSDTSKRGKERFVRVSWEKALDLAAGELKRVQKDYGPKALFGGSIGWNSAGMVHEHYNKLKRFLNLSGGFVDKIATYSNGAIRLSLPYITGSGTSFFKPSCWDVTIKNVDTYVIFGSDPYVTGQVNWQATAHRGFSYFDKFIKEKKKRGIKIINVNPVYTETAQKFDAEQLSIIPNTDTALILGIANYMYKKDWHDKKFLKKYTTGSEEFFKYLVGKTDGVDKTPEWAEKITSISAAKMKELAKLFVSGKTMLTSGWATQRGDHGEQPNWAMITLAAMIGQIGTPGGGYAITQGIAGVGVPVGKGPGLPGFPKKFGPDVVKKMPWVNGIGEGIPVARISEMLLNPGKAYQFNGKDYTYPDIKMIWWASGNPFHHHQNVNRLLKAWEKPETVIVNEIFWTATAKMADIVFPACTPYERNDLNFVGYAGRAGLFPMKKVVEPVGESKNDFEIYCELAKRLGKGYEKIYSNGLDEMGWVKFNYEEALKQAKAKNIKMPSFDEFWEKGEIVDFEITEESKNYVQYEKFRKNPRKNRLGTETGKFVIYSKKIEGYNYDDCKPHPTWFEPVEWLGSKKAKKHPYHLLSPHPKHRLHAQMNNTWIRHIYEVQGREPILINPKDAKKKGIKDGDVVRVFNDRGATLAGAVVTNTIRENVVQIYEGSWYSPVDLKNGNTMCAHGHVNTLTTDDVSTSKLTQATVATTCLVDFEKYEGELPTVTAFIPPERI